MTVDLTTGEVLPDYTEAEFREFVSYILTVQDEAPRRIIDAFQRRAWIAGGYESWDAMCREEGIQLRLPRDERQQIVFELRSAGMSTRAIGSALGVSKDSVHRDLASVSSETVGTPDTVTSLDGRQRPATRPPADSPGVGDEPGYECGVCFDTFPVEVWHCPADDHHWTIGDDECRNCHDFERQADGTVRRIVVDAEIVDEPATPRTPPRRALPDQFFEAAYDLNKHAERVHRLINDDRWPQNKEQIALRHKNDLFRTADLLAEVLRALPHN